MFKKQSIANSNSIAYPNLAVWISIILIFVMEVIKVWKNNISKGIPWMDGDPWMHLAAYKEFLKTGDWYSRIVPSINYPFGDHLEWSRAFDLILYAGHKTLGLFFNDSQALIIWAMWISPIFGLLTFYLFMKILKQLSVTRIYFILCTLLFAATTIKICTFTIGRADHHSVFMSWYVGFILTMLNFFKNPNHLKAFYVSVMLSLGLWFSPETLPAMFIINGYFCLTYVFDQQKIAPNIFSTIFGSLFILIIGVIFLEHPLNEFFKVQHDRISIVHLSLIAGLFIFSIITVLASKLSVKSRITTFVIFYGGLFCLMQYLFPGFYKGPLAAYSVYSDPSIKDYVSYLTSVGELKRASLFQGFAHCIFLITLLLFSRHQKRNEFFVFMWIGCITFLLLYLSAWRYFYYYVPTIFIASIPFFQRLSSFMENKGYKIIKNFIEQKKEIFVYALNFLIVTVLWFLWSDFPDLNDDEYLDLSKHKKQYIENLNQEEKLILKHKKCVQNCDVNFLKETQKVTLYDYIQKEQFAFEKTPVTIMVPAHYGPNIVCFTKHRSVGGYYTHNFGIVDTENFFNAKNNHVLMDIIKRRDIKIIAFDLEALDPESILHQWIKGDLPQNIKEYLKPPKGPYVFIIK